MRDDENCTFNAYSFAPFNAYSAVRCNFGRCASNAEQHWQPDNRSREGAHELSYLVLWQAVPVRDGGGRGEAKVRAVGVPAPVCDLLISFA